MIEPTTQPQILETAKQEAKKSVKKRIYGQDTITAILQLIKEGKTPREISKLPEMPALPKVKRIIKANS